jgi:hypothetical protein
MGRGNIVIRVPEEIICGAATNLSVHQWLSLGAASGQGLHLFRADAAIIGT